MSASRNLGIREARGLLISLLDADDAWMLGKLAHQVELLQRHPGTAMVCGATLYWHSWNVDAERSDAVVLIGDKTPDGQSRGSIEQDRLYEPAELLRRLYPLGGGVGPTPSSLMFVREAAMNVGGFEESFPGMFEDQAFLTKMYLSGRTFVSGTCVNFYRQHEESCCAVTSASGRSREAQSRFLKWIKAYLGQSAATTRWFGSSSPPG